MAAPESTKFNFYSRKSEWFSGKQDICEDYQFSEFPNELTKKVTLLTHFREYLAAQTKTAKSSHPLPDPIIIPSEPVYVKKWIKSSHSILFRLSNKVVQVVFKDSTEIILNAKDKYVSYVNKGGE